MCELVFKKKEGGVKSHEGHTCNPKKGLGTHAHSQVLPQTQKTEKLILIDPALLVLQFGSCDWRSFV